MTRTAWHQARAAAANSGRSGPRTFRTWSWTQHRPGKQTSVGSRFVTLRRPTAALNLSWLLFDVAARRGRGRGAKRALRRGLDAQRRHPGPRPAGRGRVLPVPERQGPGGRGRGDTEAGPGESRGGGREAPLRGRHDRRCPPGENRGLPGGARSGDREGRDPDAAGRPRDRRRRLAERSRGRGGAPERRQRRRDRGNRGRPDRARGESAAGPRRRALRGPARGEPRPVGPGGGPALARRGGLHQPRVLLQLHRPPVRGQLRGCAPFPVSRFHGGPEHLRDAGGSRAGAAPRVSETCRTRSCWRSGRATTT